MTIPNDNNIERHLNHKLTYNERSMSSYPIGPMYVDGLLIYNDYKGSVEERDDYFVWCEDCEIKIEATSLSRWHERTGNSFTIEPLSTIEGLLEVMKNDN